MKHFALVGNPNCGKTTLFNILTGSTARVGNWPGITVDKKTGTYKKLKEEIEIIDLPGTYSISPYTPEEIITRNVLVDSDIDLVINVVDSTNLERNLYLTTQLMEIDIPIVIALNMVDILKEKGIRIDIDELSKTLDLPVIEVSALKGKGIDELMKIAYKESFNKRKGVSVFSDTTIKPLVKSISNSLRHSAVNSPVFHAVKIIEHDELEYQEHSDLINEGFNNILKKDEDYEAIIADLRYRFIEKYINKFLFKKGENNLTKSEKIDKVLTHKIWAIPLFMIAMFIIFHITFSEDFLFMGLFGLEINNESWINFFTGMGYSGEALTGIPSLGIFLQNWFGFLTSSLVDGVRQLFALGGESVSNSWYAALICDGILTGLDSVISFVPQILLLFLFIAILEDSGYMARIAFILDRLFRKIGLSGRAFIPMLTGFGCSVPAIMATRTLENQKEKNRTIRLLTCFSCGAKAPIWALLAGVASALGFAFADIFVFSIYFGGIILAIVLAIIMKVFSKDHQISPFILELPDYHRPQAKNVLALLWEKFKHYVVKAGTVIALCLVIIWFLQTFGFENNSFVMVEDIANSLLGIIGRYIKYIFYPCGWAIGSDGWKYVVSSFTGLVAKENIVGTMAVLFNNGSEDTLQQSITSLSGAGIYSFAVFNLLTLPCMAAVSTARGEQTRKEFIKTILFWIGISYISSAIIYWLGTLLELIPWLGILIIVLIILALSLIIVCRRKKLRCC